MPEYSETREWKAKWAKFTEMLDEACKNPNFLEIWESHIQEVFKLQDQVNGNKDPKAQRELDKKLLTLFKGLKLAEGMKTDTLNASDESSELGGRFIDFGLEHPDANVSLENDFDQVLESMSLWDNSKYL